MAVLALISSAASGDRQAAHTLLSTVLPRVRNLVRYLVRGDDIDDIAQESLVAIVRGLPSFRGDGTFEAWVDRIVARITLEACRKRRVDAARTAPLDDSEAALSESAPLDEYIARRRMLEALDELSLDIRHTLILHHVVGMSVPDIAAEFDVPFETVRSRLRLGRTRLKERWKPEETETARVS